jgi:hypothetical protein
VSGPRGCRCAATHRRWTRGLSIQSMSARRGRTRRRPARPSVRPRPTCVVRRSSLPSPARWAASCLSGFGGTASPRDIRGSAQAGRGFQQRCAIGTVWIVGSVQLRCCKSSVDCAVQLRCCRGAVEGASCVFDAALSCHFVVLHGAACSLPPTRRAATSPRAPRGDEGGRPSKPRWQAWRRRQAHARCARGLGFRIQGLGFRRRAREVRAAACGGTWGLANVWSQPGWSCVEKRTGEPAHEGTARGAPVSGSFCTASVANQ